MSYFYDKFLGAGRDSGGSGGGGGLPANGEYDYIVCDPLDQEANGTTIFNTISDCLTYIKTDNTGALIGSIYVRPLQSGALWVEDLSIAGTDWTIANNKMAWSGLKIVFDPNTGLQGRQFIGNTTSNSMGANTYTYDFENNCFDRSTGATNLNTDPTVYPFIGVYTQAGGLVGVFEVSALTTTKATLAIDLYAGATTHDPKAFKIIQLPFCFQNITIIGDLKQGVAVDDDFVINLYAVDGFYHEGKIYSDIVALNNNYAIQAYLSKAKVGTITDFKDDAIGGNPMINVQYSNFEFDVIRNMRSLIGNLYLDQSTAKGNLMENLFSDANGGGMTLQQCHVTIGRMVNCATTPVNEAWGGAFYTGASDSYIEVGSIENCVAGDGGGFLTDGSGNRIVIGKISGCTATTGSAFASNAGGNFITVGCIQNCNSTSNGTVHLAATTRQVLMISFGAGNTSAGGATGIYCDAATTAVLVIGNLNGLFNVGFTNSSTLFG